MTPDLENGRLEMGKAPNTAFLIEDVCPTGNDHDYALVSRGQMDIPDYMSVSLLLC